MVTLSPNNVHTRILDRLYEEVTSVEDGHFPEPTGWGVDIWSFECSVFAGDGERIRAFSIFDINYADYAGEMLDGGGLDAQELGENQVIKRFDEAVERADVFIVLIDGHRLLRLMRGEPRWEPWLDNYLRARLATMTKVARKRHTWRPVQFVITKWDIFEDEFSFEDVRSKILAQPSLHDFLEGRRESGGAPIRLIPVSVTGRFARLDEEGVMVKVPTEAIRPLNLDIPFAAVLPDQIRAARQEAAQRAAGDTGNGLAENKITDRIRWFERVRRGSDTARAPLLNLVGRYFDNRGATPRGKANASAALEQAFQWLDQLAERRQQAAEYELSELRRIHRARQARIESHNAALCLAIESFDARLREFEKAFPGSFLLERKFTE
ncbi:GTPase domain-containing protein [Actinomadura spongiicola]|uniref:GTPase domain-containing protein n=1 Tax=Actinomadura spongiicola TaxID=2303421 RepID=UPI0011C1672B|nr:GTPase domain-containing protein [Actinomadura spongiicola]